MKIIDNTPDFFYEFAKHDIFSWQRIDDQDLMVTVDSTKLSPKAKEFLKRTDKTTELSFIDAAAHLIYEGPKILMLDELDFEALELTDLNIKVEEYSQPFDTLIIKLPEAYARKRKIVPKSFAINEEEEYAQGMIVRHIKKSNIILVIGFSKTGTGSSITFNHPTNTIEEQIQTKIDRHKDAAIPEFWTVIRAVLNACLIIDEYGAKRIGPQNPKYYDRLLKYEKKGDFDAMIKRKKHPMIYKLDQRVELVKRESITTETTETGIKRGPHHRRGHYRMQPCGKGNTERKRIRIAPVFVNAHLYIGSMKDAMAHYFKRGNNHG